MAPFDSSPCREFGLAPEGKTHPCLEPGWGERDCPMNTRCRQWLHAREHEMYKLGYPYASWVVRKRFFGLRTECALQFLRDPPAPGPAQGQGAGVLKVTRAI